MIQRFGFVLSKAPPPPLDVSARDAFLRAVASAPASWPAIGDDVVHRVVAERQRDIFGHLNLAPEKPGSRVEGDSRKLSCSTGIGSGEGSHQAIHWLMRELRPF
jgi:hypothetical protein